MLAKVFDAISFILRMREAAAIASRGSPEEVRSFLLSA
jgi:hypothetical protein